MNFPELWAAVLGDGGSRPAVLDPSGAVSMTFAGLDEASAEIARLFAIREPGMVVSLRAPNSAGWLANLLGIWKAGGCALLIDASLPQASAEAAERRCGARWRLGGGGAVALRNDGGTAWPFDVIKLTSGTTGEPRPLGFEAAQLVADCDQILGTMGIGTGDINYGLTAFSHSYGFSNLVTPLLCRGIPVVAAGDALPHAVADGLRASGATVLPSVPAVFQALASIDGDFSSLRLCISAGAMLRGSTGRRFRERFGRKLHSFYGASECGGICYDRSEELIDADGFVGTPMDGVELCEIEDDESAGSRMAVRSPAVCASDFGAGSVRDGRFFPPDRLKRHGDGLRIVGRDSDAINVAGRKTQPGEIERVIRACPGVEDVVVFGVPDASRGQAVVAWVVGEATRETVAAACGRGLAGWQVPREICLVSAIPLNARGKVSRLRIAAAHIAGEIP